MKMFNFFYSSALIDKKVDFKSSISVQVSCGFYDLDQSKWSGFGAFKQQLLFALI